MTLLDDTFDFDEWSALHERDPETFERRRRELLEQALAQGTEEQSRRMRRMLADFEARSTSLSDAQRAAEANRLAVESMRALGRELERVQAVLQPATQADVPSTVIATQPAGFRAKPGAAKRRRRSRSSVH